MNRRVRDITWAAIIAALYVILTLVLAPISFGIIQLRLSEVLTVLPVFTPAAVPGIMLGCLLGNLLNPQNLGPIDIIFGTGASGLAAWLTYLLGKRYRRIKKTAAVSEQRQVMLARIAALLPPVIVNALIVGVYLPFLLLEQVTAAVVLLSVLSLALSQSVVLLLLGYPLLVNIERSPLALMMERT